MGRTHHILAFATSAAALALGCSGTPPNEPAYATGLRQAAQEPALYSISYDEQGPFLLTYFPVLASPFTCDSLTTLPMPSSILELWTPLATGTFAVGPSNSDSFPPASGQAVVVFRAGSAETPVEILPVSGQVVITSAPTDPADELAGTHLAGSFHLGFPADPVYPSDCFAGGAFGPDGGLSNLESWCLCRDAAGQTASVCDGGDRSQCCLSSQPASFFLDGTFDTPPCGALCVDPAATNYCEPLWPDGGEGSCQNITCNGVCCNPDEECERTTCCPEAQACDGLCCAAGEACLPLQGNGLTCCSAAQTCAGVCCPSSETCLRDDAGASFCGA